MLRAGLIVTAVAGAGIAPAALAQKPPKPPKGGYALSIDVKPAIVVFGTATALSGKLAGPEHSGVAVRLQQDATVPLGNDFKNTGLTTTTNPAGGWGIAVKPSVNTLFRAVARTSPDTTSAARLVSVRPRVGIKLSDSTPASGSRVRFSGSVLPAHDGLRALIQRRTSTGRFVTVARATLTDAGAARSAYSRLVRVRSDGVYRVKVAGHGDHVNGFSRTRSVDAH